MTLAPSTLRRHKVTPKLADAWRCPLKAMTPEDQRWSPALARGNAIHNLLKLDGLRQIRGHELLDPLRMALRGTPHGLMREDEEYLDLAAAAIAGMRRFLSEQELDLLCVEEFVNSGDRPLSGMTDVVVVLSGRVDAVCRRRSTGTLVLVDAKTGKSLPSEIELVERPSSFIYHYLGACLRRRHPEIGRTTSNDVEIVQVLPHTGEWTLARLDDTAIAAGRAFVREMALAMERGELVAVRGEWCAYCPLGQSGACPEMHAAPSYVEEW